MCTISTLVKDCLTYTETQSETKKHSIPCQKERNPVQSEKLEIQVRRLTKPYLWEAKNKFLANQKNRKPMLPTLGSSSIPQNYELQHPLFVQIVKPNKRDEEHERKNLFFNENWRMV